MPFLCANLCQSQTSNFRFAGVTYSFNRLPMGISPAPAILQKIILEVLAPINLPINFGYLDDITLVGKPKLLRKQARRVQARLRALNFKINYSKSVLAPTEKINFLGVNYDWKAKVKSLPKEHLRAIPSAIRSLGTHRDRSAKGFLAFALFVIFDDFAALRLPRFLLTLCFCVWLYKNQFSAALLPAVASPNIFVVDATPSQVAVCDVDRNEVLVIAPESTSYQYHTELDAAILVTMMASPGDILYTDCIGVFNLGKRTLSRFPYRTLCQAAVPLEFRHVPTGENPADEYSRVDISAALPITWKDSELKARTFRWENNL